MKYKETIAIVNDPDVTLGSLENNNIKSLNAWELKWEEMTNSYDYIILGGHMGAYDTDKHEYLLSENKWLSKACLLYTSPSPRDRTRSRMPSSA